MTIQPRSSAWPADRVAEDLAASLRAVAGMAGVKPEEFKPVLTPRPHAGAAPSDGEGVHANGQGGPFIPGMSPDHRVALDSLNTDMAAMDARTDQYSLAVVGYRMLSGTLPLEGAERLPRSDGTRLCVAGLPYSYHPHWTTTTGGTAW